MALHWNWSDKVGEMTYRLNRIGTEGKVSLYEGNAFLIMLFEYKDEYSGADMYNLYSFWADEEHMKNMLGLNPKKGYGKNEYVSEDQSVIAFRFNKAKCRHLNKIVPALVKAFDNITIEIYSE